MMESGSSSSGFVSGSGLMVNPVTAKDPKIASSWLGPISRVEVS